MLLKPGFCALCVRYALSINSNVGIGHLLVVVPPLPHRAHRIVVDLGGIGDVVALPRVGLVLLDLLLDEIEVALADIQEAVRQHPRGTGNLVDEVAPGRRLRRRQHLAGRRFPGVPRRTIRLTVDADDAGRHVAQKPDRHLAVEIDVLDELADQEIVRCVRQARRAPDSRRPRRCPARPGDSLGLLGLPGAPDDGPCERLRNPIPTAPRVPRTK